MELFLPPARGQISGLQPGGWVRIRSPAEIAATLDERGTVDGLPFMSEMGALCGQTFRIRSRPGKTCVDARPMQMRTFPAKDVFLLEGARCSGAAHGGCQRECSLFWKRESLEPAGGPDPLSAPNPGSMPPSESHAPPTVFNSANGGETYRCQSTALLNATAPLTSRGRLGTAWWDWRSGNLTSGQILVRFVEPAWRKILRRIRGIVPRGIAKKTPTFSLGLQVGDKVRVKSLEEILPTLDVEGRNRGLVFEPDMTGFCGREYRVRGRVDRMISESTGKMIPLTHTVTLEEIVCTCPFTFGGCPRAELQLWREIWLEKIG